MRWRTASPLFLDFIVRKPFANSALMQHRSGWLWWMASRAPQCWRRNLRHLCVSSNQDPTYNPVSKCVYYAAKQEWLAVVGGLEGGKGLVQWQGASFRHSTYLQRFNYTLRVSGGLQEWLAVVGGLKGAKGLARWQELRRAVALQLGDIEPGVQQAALKCMKVRIADKLPANRFTGS